MATFLWVTLPLMMPSIVLVFALKLLRVFQTFEIELLLGTPINFFVYSTYLYSILQDSPPAYGKAPGRFCEWTRQAHHRCQP